MSLIRVTVNESYQLTSEQKERVRKVAMMNDENIDYSDIPPLSNEMFEQLSNSDLYRPVKKQITAKVDADVLAWLKASGKGYQTRLNTILRQAMLKDLKGA